MIESSFHLRKRRYSTCINKTKEEQEKDLIGIPKNIGPYELIEKLKDGGYSKIYKAKSYYTGDFVAIKAIEKMCFQESPEDVLLMVRQAEVLKILKHRNLINLYEIYESQKFFYLIMDYLPNGDLIEQIIKKKRFQEHEALAIFSQLVDALYYMHKNEICHRDIRTEKILFDKKNKPKLVGFSYSTFYTKGKKIRESYGSLCYACPEIIQNDYYNPELADVWSLGVVLYVMICGYLPFSDDDDEENKYLIINGKVEYPPQISNKVKDLLKHMLEVDPNKRYTFQKIIKHPWFKPFDEQTLTGGCNPYTMIYPVDERILKLIVIYGFNMKEVDKDLKQNIFNCRTGLYKQLTDKLLYMGFTSFSDLCSDDFMTFSRDKENIISDGEIKYKKYINKILEKIKKVERYIEDYKRKEDKIIKDLEDIYNDAVLEERKNNQMKEKNIDKRYMNLKTENYGNKNQISSNKRMTISPFHTTKEQKAIKNIYNQNKNTKQIEEDYVMLQGINGKYKMELKNNSILNSEESFFDINISKLKRNNSNPNIKDFVQKLIEKEDKARYMLELDNELDTENINKIRNSKRKRQFSVMIKRKKKNYLNAGSENDYFLKKPKDKDERKKKIEDNYKKSIKDIIIEENLNEEKVEQNHESDKNNNSNNTLKDKNENNTLNEKQEIKPDENKRKKSVRFSFCFKDDDSDEEEEEEEEGSISKIDSKKVSMYDIDEEIKELKEIKNSIKSPIRSSFLKRNSKDNNLINFNMESNSSIFGEHLDENVKRRNSNALLLENINEKYDLLTELKRLSDKAYGKKKLSINEEKNKIDEKEEINEFNYDSFGESKNEQETKNQNIENKDNEKTKINNNLIVFDDKFEISFHEDKNNINNEKNKNICENNISNFMLNNLEKESKKNINKYMVYYNDKNKISKYNFDNKFEEILLSIETIILKKENQYNYIFRKDKLTIKQLNITNDENNIVDYYLNSDKLNNNENNNNKKFKIKFNKINKKEKKSNYNNINKYIENKTNQKDFKNNKNVTITENIKSRNKNKSNIKNKYNINQMLNNKINNIINFYNQNDNVNQKIYIFDNSKSKQNSQRSYRRTINNKTRQNDININSNDNTINNISIKNNYGNYVLNNSNNKNRENKVQKYNKINYTQYINNLDLTNIKIRLTNNKPNKIDDIFLSPIKKSIDSSIYDKKMKLLPQNSTKLKSDKKQKISFNTIKKESSLTNISSNDKNMFSKKKINNIILLKKSMLLPKNLNYNYIYSLIPNISKDRTGHLSFEKAFHYSLMDDENELLETHEKFISKIKKGQRLNKLLSNEKIKIQKSKKYYNKFVNKKSNEKNKNIANYSYQYIKRLNFNKNNYNMNNYDYDDIDINKTIS